MRGWPGRFVGLLVLLMLGACGGTNTAPEHDRAISAGKPFLHSLDALVESDGKVEYTATLEDGRPLPGWLSFDPESRTFRGVAPDDLADGSAVRVQVVATGASGTLAKTSFDLIVMQATADVPVIVNPAEELIEFDPRGLLRWSAVAGADAYEVWAYRDAGLTQVQEFSGALESRQYQFTQLLGGQTYHVKIYFRASGVWKEMPTFTLQTTSTVVKSRLTNSQEELEALGPSATLRWTGVQGADVYELWIYRDAALVAFAETSGPVRITQYQITSLTPGATYHAQVYARVNGQFTAGGALTIKVTSQLDKARILNPQEELDNFATNGILRWSPVTGATAYELWVFTNPNSSEIYESSGSLTSRSYATRTLQPGKVYYAQAFSLVNGQWQVGAPVKITTASQVTQSRLTNPQEELEAFATNGTLRWTEVAGATAYELWIYGNAGLGTIIESGANPDRSYQPKKLCSGATYYVQVYALVNGVWTTGWATRLDVTQGTSAADCKPPAPTVRLAADPVEVTIGRTATLSWTTQFASSCSASGAWSGARGTNGSESIGPLTQYSLYILTCTGPGGTSRAESLVPVAGFTVGGMADRYYLTYPANPGYLSRIGKVLEFDGGTSQGRMLEFVNTGASESGRNDPFTWSVTDGNLNLDFTPAIEQLSLADVSSLDLTDAERALLTQFGLPTNQVEVIYRLIGYRYSRRLASPPYQEADQTTVSEMAVPPIPLSNGTTLTLSRYPKPQGGTGRVILRADDEVEPVPFSVACPDAGGAICVPGGWAGSYPYSPGAGPGGVALPVSIYGDLMQFNASGTADGTFAAHAATWTVDAGGTLVISHANGWTQRTRILDVLPPVYGVVNEFSDGTQRFAGYQNVVRSDPAFRFTDAYLTSTPGKFWHSDINGWNASFLAPDGSISLGSYFGWEFVVPGPAAWNYSGLTAFDCDADGQADDVRASRAANTWMLLGDGRLEIDRRPSQPRTILRYWIPIAPANVGGSRVFHVVEAQYTSGSVSIAPRLNNLRELNRIWNCIN